MSTIRTTVEILEDVRPHANSDNLNLATVRGWQMVMNDRNGLNPRVTGDRVVYFEAGTVLPRALADQLGVVQYLQERTDISGNCVLVVGKVRLRGEPSFGLIIPLPENRDYWEAGRDVSDFYGTYKYLPMVKTTAGDADEDHPGFPRYTDVENLRNFPKVLQEGEQIEVTEKICGVNARIGFVVERDPARTEEPYTKVNNQRVITLLQMAGSRELRRKDPGPENWAQNTYWFPWTFPAIKNLMHHIYGELRADQAVLYGEVYGGATQKGFPYGETRPRYRAFSLMINGKFLDSQEFYYLMSSYRVPVVPQLYCGPYNLEKIKELSEGKSLVPSESKGVPLEKTHMREGVVVVPSTERTDPQVGRVILKYISDSFLFRRSGDKDDTTEQ